MPRVRQAMQDPIISPRTRGHEANSARRRRRSRTYRQKLNHIHRSLRNGVRRRLLFESGLGFGAIEGQPRRGPGPRRRGDKHGLLGNRLRLVR